MVMLTATAFLLFPLSYFFFLLSYFFSPLPFSLFFHLSFVIRSSLLRLLSSQYYPPLLSSLCVFPLLLSFAFMSGFPSR